ncbi:MAG: hypothetical protein HY962_16840 [Ignavibacteriae bacterium]|nr:hypothetical protein [Ignavibacteriota bacterium]
MRNRADILDNDTIQRGTWWAPGVDEIMYGDLTKHVDGHFTLLVIGTMGFEPDAKKPTVIFGVTASGTKYSLFNPSIPLRYTYGPEINEITFRPSVVIRNGHFESPAHISSRNVQMEIDNLEWWMNETGTTFRHDHDGSFIMRYAMPETVTLGEVHGCTIELHPYLLRTRDGANSTFKEHWRVVATSTESRALPAWESTLEIVRLFFVIGTEYPFVPKRYLLIGSGDEEHEDNYHVYPSYTQPPVEQQNDGSIRQLYTYRDLKDNIRKYFQEYVSSYERHTDMYREYISNIFHTQLLRRKFTSFTSALEYYSNQQYDNRYLSPAEYQAAILDSILPAVPSTVTEDFRVKLISMLKNANTLTLREKLAKVVDCCRPYLPTNVVVDARIPAEMAALRNRLTHIGGNTERTKGKNGTSLFRLANLAGLITACVLLKEMGLESAQTMTLLVGSKFYPWVLSNGKHT